MMPTARFPKPDAVAAGFVPASPPSASCGVVRELEVRQSDIAREVDREDLRQAGGFCDASHLCLLWRDHEHELLVTCLDGHRGPYEQADDRGVDERAVAEINEYVGVSGGLFERRTKL